MRRKVLIEIDYDYLLEILDAKRNDEIMLELEKEVSNGTIIPFEDDEKRDVVCDLFNIDDIGEFSDGYHTFNSLYHQRAVLFATIVNTYSDKAWKSHRHSDGELCFGKEGWFVVGVTTPLGNYTYHYEDKYWSMFNCTELETAPEWDGHTDKDVTRLLSLTAEPGKRHLKDAVAIADINYIMEHGVYRKNTGE